MTDDRRYSEKQTRKTVKNPWYAQFQLARALTTSETHSDAKTRERAVEKAAKWETVLRNILSGSVDYGSRTPVNGIPEWATLEVVTGGFATGDLLAGGPLQEHENKLLANMQGVPAGDERRALNAYFLTDTGLQQLIDMLRSGCYDITVPEEGALLVVAWLVENGYGETFDTHKLLEEISPFFSRLRFYPVPLDKPRRFGYHVYLQNVGRTIENIRRIKPNNRILAQKEAVEVWAPFHDRVVSLFLETVANDWPCQKYPEGWPQRALALIGEYAELRKTHKLCGKPDRADGHYALLRGFLGKCAREPEALTGREVGLIRHIIKKYIEKRGAPDSPGCIEARRRQMDDVSAPTNHAIAGVVIPRLEQHSREDGLDDVSLLNEAVDDEEAVKHNIRAGTEIPFSIQRKVERCLKETVEILVERGLITSGDTLAGVLPQMTSEIRAAGIKDPMLRQLYAAIYQAFRRRRSLLLLNLEKQVQIEELPWIEEIDFFRKESLSSRELSRQALDEIVALTLTSFPQAILPNKLLQEIRSLLTGADLNIPIVDELAADIFMGEFSGKFMESAKTAADLLTGSLYAVYYDIDYGEVRKIPMKKETRKSFWFRRTTREIPDKFARLCASRAGVSLGTWDPAVNGMILEQQQILTTQNLAALFTGLDLRNKLGDQLEDMARQCFMWICRRHQMKVDAWHARLIRLKNSAYAWRQMVFYLALLPDNIVSNYIIWADEKLNEQPIEFGAKFRPALKGLKLASEGVSPESKAAAGSGARCFLGWTKTKHWLLKDRQDQ